MGRSFRNRLLTVFAALGLLASGSTAIAGSGDVDRSFSEDGRRIWDSSRSEDGWSVGVGPGHRIVVVGSVQTPGRRRAVAVRFHQDGRLDRSFAGDGVRWLPLEARYGFDAPAMTAVVEPNGRIVVVGMEGSELRAVRLRVDGTIDRGFGRDGVFRFALPDGGPVPSLIELFPDGRIVIGGWYSHSDDGGMFLIRLREDGRIDRTFGDDGHTITLLPFLEPGGMAVDSRGRVVVAGTRSHGTGGADFAVARMRRDGGLDGSFADEGVLRNGGWGVPADVVIDEVDRPVVVGNTSGVTTVRRYTTSGELDESFGEASPGTTRFEDTQAQAVVLQRNGKIVLGGTDYGPSIDVPNRLAAFRLKTDGTIDKAFGRQGKASVGFTGEAYGLDVVIDGTRIVVAGERWNPAEKASDYAVAAFLVR